MTQQTTAESFPHPSFLESKQEVFPSKKAIKASRDRGRVFSFPEKLREGQNIWFRVNVYYPQGWTFDCGGCTQGMKFMRIHTADASGKNEVSCNLITGGQSARLLNVHRSQHHSNRKTRL